MDLNFQSLTPYPTFRSKKKENEFMFTTESGDEYAIYYHETDGYFPELSYVNSVKLFGFDITSKASETQFDKRISDTIITSIFDFLKDDKNILVYVCSQSDSRQRHRNRLFNQWFREYSQNRFFKGDVTFDGDTFVSFITSRKNPYIGDFNQAFFNFGNEYK
jgi:Family of unknown function (DUF6169)